MELGAPGDYFAAGLLAAAGFRCLSKKSLKALRLSGVSNPEPLAGKDRKCRGIKQDEIFGMDRQGQQPAERQNTLLQGSL